MELWDLYTVDREKTGQTMVRGESVPDGYYRLVVHVCIFNERGEMLIQQRQPFKKGWSNMWDVSVGGSAISGDTSQSAAERELCEELGIRVSFEKTRPALTLYFRNGFDDFYMVEKDVDLETLTLQYDEVQAVRWADLDTVLGMIDEGVFIPYHKSLVEMLFYMRDHKGTLMRDDDTSPTEKGVPDNA